MSGSKWSGVAWGLVAFAVGCGGGGGETSLGSGGTAGDGTTVSVGGSGGTGSPTTTSTGGTLATTSSGGGVGGTGGGSADCPEGGLYALSDVGLDENVVSMCKYKGDVLLIVNVAEA